MAAVLRTQMAADEGMDGGLDGRRERLNAVTETIIGSAFTVSSTLGHGFLEKVYENALTLQLRDAGLHVERQRRLDVYYRDDIVGQYVADLVVEQEVLVEIKAASALTEVHFAQCHNYLRATGLPICLLLNFGTPKLQIRRIVNRF